MKNSFPKDNITLPEQFRDIENSFDRNNNLLIIAETESLKVSYINHLVEDFFGLEPSECYKEPSFHKSIMHPEDYTNYLVHLNACQNLSQWEVKEIILRLKEANGNWGKFCFKDRLYNLSDNKTPQVISIVLKIGPSDDKDQPCEEPSEIENPNSRYQQLLESIDEAYCIIEMIFDRDGKPVDYLFTEINTAFENQTNLKNVKGKTIKELVPLQEAHWFQIYGDIAVTGKSQRFQEFGENLDSSWFDVYAFKIGNKASRKVAVLFRNITTRKNEEEVLLKTKIELEENIKNRQKELEENNELLQTVFDTTDLAIVLFKTLYDKNGKADDFLFVRINKVLKALYKDINPLGKTYSQVSRHGREMGVYDALLKVSETGEPLDQELFFDKVGYNHWFRITARKQKEFVIATMEDISARKKEAQDLKEAVKFNEQLVQTSPDTIMIINLNEFKIRYINQDLLGGAEMTRDRIVGMTLADMLVYMHPRDREKIINFHKRIIKSSNDDIHEIEFRVKTKGKTWEWFNARGKIFSRKNDKWVDEYVVIVRNITEQKTTQKALTNAENLSIQGEVARTLAHELRNPLASIRMATDVIKHKMKEPEKSLLSNYFEILSRSTKVLNNLVSNLLNSSNYTAPVLVTEDLAQILNETIEQAADRIYLTGIKVQKNFEGYYPILADKERLKIALLNIIVNASEATAPAKGIINIEIKKIKTDFQLSITDNGHGLEKDQINRLFDAFYTNKASGLGIGLNSVKNILEDHDAQIQVNSTPQVGTTFKILFHNAEKD